MTLTLALIALSLTFRFYAVAEEFSIVSVTIAAGISLLWKLNKKTKFYFLKQ